MASLGTQSPFTVGGMVTNPESFIGRRDAVNFIMRQMTNVQPGSINITGPRKCGKSSLLYYISQVYALRVGRYGRQHDEFAVIYFSGQEIVPRKRTNLYQRLAEKLRVQPSIRRTTQLHSRLSESLWTESYFRSMLEMSQESGILPVICFDDIEELLALRDEFTHEFYDYLSMLLNLQLVMMVIASREPLVKYKRKYQQHSNFFDVVHVFSLEEFSDEEAMDILQLPNRDHPALGSGKRKLAQTWGGHHPSRLQLAAYSLWLAQVEQRNESWAKRYFEQQLLNLPERTSPLKYPIRAAEFLGQYAQDIGDLIDDISNFVKGVILIAVLILGGLGLMNTTQIAQWFHDNVIEEVLGIND